MVTPSRWFAGGRGLDEFRERDAGATGAFAPSWTIPNRCDVFPGVDIKGGVSLLPLGLVDHDGDCDDPRRSRAASRRRRDGRSLDEYDIFVRDNEAVSILRQGACDAERGSRSTASPACRRLRSAVRAANELPRGQRQSESRMTRQCFVYQNGGLGAIDRGAIRENADWVDKWKVLVGRSRARRAADRRRHATR